MRVTVLGCGGSGGVPLIGGHWGACDPTNPRNRRLRVSALVEKGEIRVLIDTSPDLRQQLLDAGVGRLDAVLYTHDHGDHLNGIDDLRTVNRNLGGPLDVYADASTLEAIRERFGYVFDPVPPGGIIYKPWLIPHEVSGPFTIGDIEVRPFRQDHGHTDTLGYRLGPIAYSTDVVELPEEAFEVLAGVKVWIVDCLQYEPHSTHAHLDKALSWIARVRPRRAVLTHMSARVDYDDLAGRLPAGVEPAYDGLAIEVED